MNEFFPPNLTCITSNSNQFVDNHTNKISSFVCSQISEPRISIFLGVIHVNKTHIPSMRRACRLPGRLSKVILILNNIERHFMNFSILSF